MADPDAAKARRLTLTLHRPALALYPGVRPTVVMAERAQPAQWGVGTWQIDPAQPVVISVYLFNRLWRFGEAEIILAAGETGDVRYRAPLLPFGRGRLEKV